MFLEERIEVIEAEDLPKDFNSDMYLELTKIQLETMRHRIWKVINQTGGKSDDPEIKLQQREMFQDVVS